MNMFKKNGGFTLVELIVVIAILAILAGIAVPAYSGYIKKAEQAGDLQMLSPIATAAQGLAIEKNATISSISVAANGTVTVAAVSNADNSTPVSITDTEVKTLTGDLSFSTNFAGDYWTPADGWNATAPSAG